MKSSASESKLFQSRSKVKIPGRAREKGVPNSAELFMYLIEGVRFGSRRVWRLNWAKVTVLKMFGSHLTVSMAIIHFNFIWHGRSSNLLRWLIHLIDLVVDNLYYFSVSISHRRSTQFLSKLNPRTFQLIPLDRM